MLLTKRTQKVKDHKGQISFPGGAREGNETLVHTALRESSEEIGLSAEEVEVLGELDDAISLTSNYVISPFVALIPWPYHFKVSEEEVDELIEAPVSAFLDGAFQHHEEENMVGEEVSSYSYHYQGKVIWGATARVLKQFLDVWVRL